MRVLVIEKKVANRYPGVYKPIGFTSDREQSSQDAGQENGTTPERLDGREEEENTADEESPLLGDRKSEEESLKEYRFPPPESYWVQKVPILACLNNASLLVAFLVAFVQAALLSSFDATVPTTATDYFGFDSLKSGLLFIPIGVPDLLFGPLGGWLVDRLGTKPVAVAGYAYCVPVFALLRIPHPGGKDQIIIYSVILALCGIGVSAIGAPSIVEAGAVVERYHRANPEFFGEDGPYAQLYGISSMVFSAGLTFGPLIAGSLSENVGYGNMNAVLAGICAITALLSLFFIGGRLKSFRFLKF